LPNQNKHSATELETSDFDYYLPSELIAQEPLPERSNSRLLTMNRNTGAIQIRHFHEIIDFLEPEDCLVLNDTQVIPARLKGRKAGTGGRVEALLCDQLSPGRWRALLKPGKRVKPGTKIEFGTPPALTALVEERLPEQSFILQFGDEDILKTLEAHGETPLPPYIRRSPTATDRERYQTVFAARPGAVAAPTAGLHFTNSLLDNIRHKGTTVVFLTLHVGPGTFQPVTEEKISEHLMHTERFSLTPATAAAVNRCRTEGGRVIAVGTTTVRVLESQAEKDGSVKPGDGWTDIFLHPPYQPQAVDGLFTNFHLPRSTLMMLVATFCGTAPLLAAYQKAIREKMRFYSYGDCMFIY